MTHGAPLPNDDLDERRLRDRRDDGDPLTARVARLELWREMFVLAFDSRYNEQKGGLKQLEQRVDLLESLKDRAVGAYALIIAFGISGWVAAAITFVRSIIKGP